MKLAVAMLVLLAAVALGYVLSSRPNSSAEIAASAVEAAPVTGEVSPVLVELYTSEGCSSCPPADRLLTDIAAQYPEVIALSFHVDYWDNDAWRDRFSSPLFTRRQEIYASRFALDSTYTPQMIVNGSKQFVGSDAKSARDAIDRQAKEKHGRIALSRTADKMTIDVQGVSGDEQSTVYLAITEDGLSSNVGGGENRGVTLKHPPVVRLLSAVSAIDKKQQSLKTEVDLPIDASWHREDLSYVVFVQENASRRVDAAARIR